MSQQDRKMKQTPKVEIVSLIFDEVMSLLELTLLIIRRMFLLEVPDNESAFCRFPNETSLKRLEIVR